MNSSWCEATTSPLTLKIRNRDEVVPWSMAPTKVVELADMVCDDGWRGIVEEEEEERGWSRVRRSTGMTQREMSEKGRQMRPRTFEERRRQMGA